MKRTIQVPVIHRGAEIRVDSFDEADNTIEIVWTTGARVRRNSWWDGPFDEELEVTPKAIRVDRLNAGAPFLNTHDSYDLRSVLGSIVPGSVKIEKGVGTARVKLSRAADVADAVLKIREGDVRNVSVGYRIHKVIKTEGQEGDVPLHRVVDWEPLEISAVPIPADPGAQVRAEGKQDGQRMNTCEIDDGRAETNHEEGATAVADKTKGSGTPGNDDVENRGGGNPPPAAPPAITSEDVTRAATEAATRAVTAERARVAAITDLARLHRVAPFGDEHIRANTSLEDFRVKLLDRLATNSERDAADPGIDPQAIDNTRVEARRAAVQNALLHRADPVTFKLDVDGAREFVGLSLIEIARECVEATGRSVRGMSKMQIAGEALAHRDASGMHTTSDFAIILGNVLNRTLRAGYEAAPQTFRSFTRIGTVPDFKEVTRAQLGEAPQFDRVNEHGEFKRGSIGEAGEKFSIATYGKVIGLTRQVIVNDDLGAFTRIPRAFGVQAAQLESDLVWGQILANPTMGDGVALFHNDHKNLGTAGAIGLTTVSEARLKMGTQTGLDGKTVLNIDPVYLVVPKALQTAAETYLTPITPAQQTHAVPESLRKLTIISEPRLDNGIARFGIAGSASNYYFFADMAAGIDIVELAYLDGQQGVFTETRQGFDIDGVEIKVRLDAGAKVLDWRGVLKNPFAG